MGKEMKFNFRELAAEFFGTACLIFVGCGSVVIGGFGADLPLGAMPIAVSFGLCLTFLIYAIGPISGCHLNPAASLGLWAAKLFPGDKILGYAVAQILGAAVGAFLLVLIAGDKASGYDVAVSGLGQNGWGPGYLGEFGTLSAFATELVTTFIFMIAILGAINNEKAGPFAGLSIGLALTAIILVFLNVTGVSLNPARSIGPAIFVGGEAINNLWLFIVAPSIGALAAGSLSSWIRE
jgi:aquaporin Z